ncbi:MAG: CDP-diacylglycerol--glycerol-3-phosphate 3-phosphatidyltransferase [Candidatus Babeliales bacterium]
MKLTKENIPILLTLTRLIISPLVVPLLFVWLLPLDLIIINSLLAVFFIALCLTDLFDGYLARKYDVQTQLGAALDPIADKFLVYATLIGLLAAGKINYYWVVLLIGREFFVMGLRLVALQERIPVPVSQLAKVKTAFQMIMLAYIIWNPYQSLSFESWANGFEAALIAVTLLLSLGTASIYARGVYHASKAIEKKKEPLIYNE